MVLQFTAFFGIISDMEIAEIKTKELTWININNPDESTADYLRKLKKRFHPLNIQDCIEVNQTPKIDIYRHYTFLVLHFPVYDFKNQRIRIYELNIFVGKGYLITVPEVEIEILEKYFRYYKNVIAKKGQNGFRASSSFLLYKILDRLYQSTLPLINTIAKNINRAEEEIYGEKIKTAVKDIMVIRRNILNLRRIIEPQKLIIDSLANLKVGFFPQEVSIYYKDIRDYLNRIWASIESFKDFVEGLNATNESLISHRTNEVIKALTIISVSLLPLTLLSGIYGMNIVGLPFANHPQALLIISGVMAVILVAILFFIRKKEWI
ncbi:magnesium transporter CorA family protein [Patescibacteria group bacterium]|nr:magnesium transporter CorA family protein [Patescibacteria group bacterium]